MVGHENLSSEIRKREDNALYPIKAEKKMLSKYPFDFVFLFHFSNDI